MNTDRTRDRRQTQRAAGSGCVVMSNSRSYQCLSVFICGSDESFAFWLRAWSLIGRNRSRGSVCRGDSTLPTGEIASNLNHQDTETPRGMICENRAYDCLTGLHSLCLGALVVQLVNGYDWSLGLGHSPFCPESHAASELHPIQYRWRCTCIERFTPHRSGRPPWRPAYSLRVRGPPGAAAATPLREML